jgi:hypothetical protein
MSDRDQDQDERLGLDDLEAGEPEFEEEPGGPHDETSEEFEPQGRELEAQPARRRFGFGGREREEASHRTMGSVRGTHERVHVDDRLSALWAIMAAAALLGVLALGLAGNWIPQPAVRTLAPLVVPTAQVPSSASPAASPSSAAPLASPTR